MRRPEVPSIVEIQLLCQRVRLAGAPGAKARTGLVAEYRRLAEGLGIPAVEVETGADLQRASVAMLKEVSGARRALGEAAAAAQAQAPQPAPQRRVGSWQR